MGLFSRLFTSPDAEPVILRSEATDNLDSYISDLISENRASMSVASALKMPPVYRAVSLITSIGSSFPLVAYRNGYPIDPQPKVVQRPSTRTSLKNWLEQSLYAMVCEGETFWWVIRDSEGAVRNLEVVPNAEVNVQWDQNRFQPVYVWRNQRMRLGDDFAHVAVGRPAGELHGVSPLRQGFEALAIAQAAEDFARSWFTSKGAPLTLIKIKEAISQDEAAKWKQQYIASRQAGGGAEPVIVPPIMDFEFPVTNPEASQLHQSREYITTTSARLFGVPSPLLIVQTSGSSVNYSNTSGLILAFVRETLQPMYIDQIEAVLTDLAPNGWTIEADYEELNRADASSKASTYKTLIDAGIITPEEVRREWRLPPITQEPAPSAPEQEPPVDGAGTD